MVEREIQNSGLSEGHKPEWLYLNSSSLKPKHAAWSQHMLHASHPAQMLMMNQHFLIREKKIKYTHYTHSMCNLKAYIFLPRKVLSSKPAICSSITRQKAM